MTQHSLIFTNRLSIKLIFMFPSLSTRCHYLVQIDPVSSAIFKQQFSWIIATDQPGLIRRGKAFTVLFYMVRTPVIPGLRTLVNYRLSSHLKNFGKLQDIISLHVRNCELQ